jgi:MFS family permease
MFVVGFGLYGQSIYLVELQRLHGWTAGLISGASTLSLLLCNILAMFTNELAGRLGPRRLVLLGVAALAASMTLLALATHPWQLYVAFILMAFGWIGMGMIVIAAIVSLWFVRRRVLALSVPFTGASAGGVIVTPLLLLLVQRLGFPAAMLTATAIMVAILVPVIIGGIGLPPKTLEPVDIAGPQHPTEDSVPGGISRTDLMRRAAFWTLSIPFALGLLAQIGFIVHQIALLEPKVGYASAGVAVSMMTFSAIVGRLAFGMVVDRFVPRFVTAASLVSQAAALLIILQADTVPMMLAASALFGFSVGNLITLPPLIIHREFEAASFVVVMGLSNAISGTIGALGPVLVALVHGWSGNYDASLVLCIVLELVAAAIVVQRGPLPVSRTASA